MEFITICQIFARFVVFRCGPCQRIAPHFEQFPGKYPRAIFLKVDVDKCQDTAASQGVSAMPTFIFYRNKVNLYNFVKFSYFTFQTKTVQAKIDRLQGASLESLEAKIQQHIGNGDEESGEDYGQGLVSTAFHCH